MFGNCYQTIGDLIDLNNARLVIGLCRPARLNKSYGKRERTNV